MACSALVPAAQAAKAPESEALRLGDEHENRQYQQVLSVAASQERRLVRHKAVRKNPGYDLNDPWLVVGDEDAPPTATRKRGRYESLVPGVPCLIVGSIQPVAYLGLVDGEPDVCEVRDMNGRKAKHPRKELMPMPTRPARQGDWALPVGLEGDESKYHGRRGICTLVGKFKSGGSGFWVSFEPADPTHPPDQILLADDNLVTLPTPPPGAPRTPWECRALALPSSSSSSLLALMDESVMESRLALRHDDDDKESDDASEELSGSEEEEELVLAQGALVALTQDMTKDGNCKRYWRIEKLEGEDDSSPVLLRLLDGRGTEATHKVAELTLVSESDLGPASKCQHCNSGEDESELLLCEHFGISCLGCAHLKCLTPPLKKVPKGQWFCQSCGGNASASSSGKALEQPAKSESTPAAKVQPKAKSNAEANPPASKASAKAVSKAAAKAKTASKQKGR